jgi:hypothetical protein
MWCGALAALAASVSAEVKIKIPSATGLVHAVGSASMRKPDGSDQKLIGVFIEGIAPEVLKGKDVMLYFSDTPEFQWLMTAEGKVISYESRAEPELEAGKGKPRIYLFDRATVKEEPKKAPDSTPGPVAPRTDARVAAVPVAADSIARPASP